MFHFKYKMYLIFLYILIAQGKAFTIVDYNNTEVNFKKECEQAQGKPCIVKCCGPDEVMFSQMDTEKCMSTEDLGKEVNLSELGDELVTYSGLDIVTANLSPSNKTLNDFRVLYNKEFKCEYVQCEKFLQLDVDLTENGSIAINISADFEAVVDAFKYCYEQIVSTTQNGTINTYKYFVTLDDASENIQRNFFIVCCSLVSSFFLLLGLIVYYLLQELRSNLHGILLMVFMASLMGVMILQSSIFIYQYHNNYVKTEDVNEQVCQVLSPILYFLVLSTFFWMNTMCYDIWWTFRSMRKVRETNRRGIWHKFGMYSLYAWGVPAAFTAVALALDYSDLPASFTKPDFNNCMYDTPDHEHRYMYKYLPMLILVVSNIILYIMTIYNIWEAKRGIMTGIQSKQNQTNNIQFAVYLRLSIIMGVNWVFEVVPELIGEAVPQWLIYVFNAYNGLVGVTIFFVLVVKRNVFVKLCELFGIENRWTRLSKRRSNRTDQTSKSSKIKSNDESMEFESLRCSHNDPKMN